MSVLSSLRAFDVPITEPLSAASLKPGTTLLRERNGTTHRILVLDNGFDTPSRQDAKQSSLWLRDPDVEPAQAADESRR